MFRFRVKKTLGTWNVWIEGELDRWLAKAESVDRVDLGNGSVQWVGQVQAVNLKMAFVRLQHLIPELQED